MAQSNLLELARQGDPQAIAALMNRTLQPKGITAQTNVEGDRLRVLLEAEQVPNRQAMTTFVQHGITSLGVSVIRAIEIMGRQTGGDRPAWTQEIYLGMPVKPNPDPVRHAAPPPPPRPSHLRLVPPPVTPLHLQPESEEVSATSGSADAADAADYQVIDQPAPLSEAQPMQRDGSAPRFEVISSEPLMPSSSANGDIADAKPPIAEEEAAVVDRDPFSPEELETVKPRLVRAGALGVGLVLLLLTAWIGAIIGYALWKELTLPAPQPAPTASPAAMQSLYPDSVSA
jgi:hypothetical protein